MYRCDSCGTQYAPQQAVMRSYFCCGQSLGRGASDDVRSVESRLEPLPSRATEVSASVGPTNGMVAVEAIPPTGNTVDALAMEGLLGSLRTRVPISLEIAADHQSRHFILRAPRDTMPHLCSQLESVYGQVEFRTLSEDEDPARQLQVVAALGRYERESERRSAMGRLRLRRLEALPLRTYRDGDFQEADPILAVLGGFGRVQEGERLLSQLLLLPAADDWADDFQPLTRPPDMRIKTESPLGTLGGFLLVGGVGVGVAVGLQVLLWALAGEWVPVAVLSAVGGSLAYAARRVYLRLGRDKALAEPSQVARKIFLAGYKFQLRVAVGAPTAAQAKRRLYQLGAAYGHFNAGAGNALALEEAVFDPCDLEAGWNGRGVLRRGTQDILNVAEVASLWHLPWGEGVPFVRKALSPHKLPLPGDVAEGVRIGESSGLGRTIPVHLPWSAVIRNKLIVARTRKGKTTLMLHLALAALDGRQAAGTRGSGNGRGDKSGVVFIDPHGDAVKRLLTAVPMDRVDDVCYLDLGDEIRVPGWNLIDTRLGLSPELLVESFRYAAKRIWTDYWGPRMEDVVQHVVATLVAANLRREREDQFTVLDIQGALILKNFQQSLRAYIEDDPELMIWWYGYYDSLHMRQRLEIVNPVLTKIQRFARTQSVRRIVSQPASTVNVVDVVNDGGVMLVNLPGGSIGLDNAGFLGSLVLTYLETAIRANQKLPEGRRPTVSCYIDECGSIPFTYQKLVAELVKMGGDFTLTAQALAQLDKIEPGLLDTLLANIDSLAVFQTSGRDARDLLVELGDPELASDHIVNLPEHSCYLKTQRDGVPLPLMRVDVADFPAREGDVAQAIQERTFRYTVDTSYADRQYKEHIREAYGMDLNAFWKQIASWQSLANKVREEQELRGDGGLAPETEKAVQKLGEEYESGGGKSKGKTLFGVGALPEELESQPKHTRTRKRNRQTPGKASS